MTVVVNTAALAFLVIAVGALMGAAYWLTIRQQLLLDHAEQILDASRLLLAEVPGKSAERTIAAVDEEPRTWWQALRNLETNPPEDDDEERAEMLRQLRDRMAAVTERMRGEQELVVVPVGPVRPERNPSTQPIVMPSPTGPPTAPDMRRAANVAPPAPDSPPLDREALRANEGDDEPIDVEQALARFTFRPGYARAQESA